MTHPPKLLLDASVLVAGAGSPTGAPALVLELCRRGATRAVVSRLILVEAERNIREKLDDAALLRFYRFTGDIDMTLVTPATSAEIEAELSLIAAKDARAQATFKERFPRPEHLCATGPEGRFVREAWSRLPRRPGRSSVRSSVRPPLRNCKGAPIAGSSSAARTPTGTCAFASTAPRRRCVATCGRRSGRQSRRSSRAAASGA